MKQIDVPPAVRKEFPRRPPRLALLSARHDAPLYFVTFCTHQRRSFLATTEVNDAFLAFATQAIEHDIGVGRYVIMPDHVHLFVRGGPEFRLGLWVASLKQTLAKSAGRDRTRGRIWQEGFFDHVIRSDESYGEKWNYVRENPVRAGLVINADDWAYQGEIISIDRA